MDRLLVSSLRWLLDRLGIRMLLSLLLITTVLFSLCLGLSSALVEVELPLLLLSAGTGLLVAWLLAGTIRPSWAGLLLAALIGLPILLLRVGGLETGIIRVLRLWGENFLVHPGWNANWAVQDPELSGFWVSVGNLITRFWNWGVGLAGGEAGYDPVSSAIFWAYTAWTAAAWAAWFTAGPRRPLTATAPAILLLGGLLSHTRSGPGLLLLALLSSFTLHAILRHEQRIRRWLSARIDYSEEIRFDLAFGSSLLILAAIGLAVVVPSISIRSVIPLRASTGSGAAENAAKSLGLRPRPPPEGPFSRPGNPGLPRLHLLGSGPELSEERVMTVRLENLVEESPADIPRLYWRALIYDRYTGHGWTTGPTQTIEYGSGDRALAGTLPFHSLIVQHIDPHKNLGGLLYSSGVLVSAAEPYQIAWRRTPASTCSSLAPDQFDPFGAAIEAGAYTAWTYVPSAAAAELRSAGSVYPEWVIQRYLDLPDAVPARVRDLARRLTAAQPTAYDRAVAIQDYLRTFPYSLDIPPPPAQREVSDYFLFELKTGFCDYYATAMVVLARAAGLPARLVTGYASGAYDPGKTSFTVTEADAHSWPEIFFPGYGWIEFEPTVARPASGPGAEGVQTDLEAGQVSAGSDEFRIPGPELPFWPAAAVSATLIALAWYAAQQLDWMLLRRQAPETAIRTIFRRMVRSGASMLPALPAGSTPSEFWQRLEGRLERQALEVRWGRWLQPAGEEASRLVEIYLRSAFSQHPAGGSEKKQAIQLWNRLRWRLLLSRLTHWIFSPKIRNRKQ